MRNSLRIRGFLALALTLLAPGVASADMLTLNLDYTFNGTTPPSPSPFATAVFTSAAAGTVNLTLTINSGGGAYIDDWLFNVNPAIDPTTLTITQNTGPTPFQPTLKGTNAFGNNSIPGFGASTSGLFDLQFQFDNPNGSRLSNTVSGNNAPTATFTITGGSITAASFNFLSASPYDANGPYYSAAHIAGYGNGQSGGIAALVPEPASLALMGVGGLAIAGAGLRRRLRSRS